MLLILILVVLLLCGGGVGYSQWGYGGGISIGGLILLLIVLWLLFGHGGLHV